VAGNYLQVDILEPGIEIVSAISCVLEAGGTVLYPSDTVYGITADASCLQAVESICTMKGYSTIRPFIVLAGSVKRALELTTQKALGHLMNRHWPGPVTLILKGAESVPQWLLSQAGTVAVRVPSDPLTCRILDSIEFDLVTTSANSKGSSFPLSTEEIPEIIIESAAMVLDGGTLHHRKPSRIIDVTGKDPVEIRN
jgi:L-threonylcarbamoyladenylate synthase